MGRKEGRKVRKGRKKKTEGYIKKTKKKGNSKIRKGRTEKEGKGKG